MRNTILLYIAAAAGLAQAENLLDIVNRVQDDDSNSLEDAADQRLGAGQKCQDKVKSVDDMNLWCYWRSPFYQSQSKETKMEQAWQALTEDGDTEPAGIWWGKFPNFFTQKSIGSFCQRSDSLGNGRPKVIHTQGLIAQVSWNVVDSRYTGILADGSDHVVMRLSESQNLNDASKGLTPAAAFKFLIDGTESQNILVQNSFMESESWNFFEKPLANRVAPFDENDHPIQFKTVHRKLTESHTRPYGLSIGHIANIKTNGDTIAKEEVKIPYELRFRPHGTVGEDFNFTDNNENWYDRLEQGLKAGDVLYDVYGLTAPESLGGTEVKIAEVQLQSDLLFSQAADEKLYFRHRPAHLDYKYYPNWRWFKVEKQNHFKKVEDGYWEENFPEDVWPEDDDEAEAFYTAQVEQNGCPFAWLLQGIQN